MEEKEIYQKINSIYKTEKGRKFIIHLSHNFLPNKVRFMLNNPESKKKVCSITGIELVDKSDIIGLLENKIINNLMDKDSVFFKDSFDGKMMAVECDGSDKLLCLPALHQLINFCATELIKQSPNQNTPNSNQQNREVKYSTTKLGDFESLKELSKKLKSQNK